LIWPGKLELSNEFSDISNENLIPESLQWRSKKLSGANWIFGMEKFYRIKGKHRKPNHVLRMLAIYQRPAEGKGKIGS